MATDLSTAISSKQPQSVGAPPPTASPPPEGPLSTPAGMGAVAVVALAFLPMLVLHCLQLWARPHYQFFPFVFLGSCVLAWTRWPRDIVLSPGSASAVVAAYVGSWLLLLGSEVVFSPVLAVLAMQAFLAAVFIRLGGWPLFRAMLPAWIFLWILVPLPFGLDRQLVLGMQWITSKTSSYVLDLFGVIHLLSGNVIEIPGRNLLVEEACAGVNSLFSLIACALFLIFFLRRSWVRGGLLLLSSVFWVLVTNVIRVTTIAIASSRFQIDLSTGRSHDMLGLGCFFLAVLLIWSTDRLFLFFKPSWGEEPVEPIRGETPVAVAGPGATLCPWPVAAAFGLLLILHLGVHRAAGLDAVAPEILPTIAEITEDSLPKTIAGWKRVRFEEKQRTRANAFGEFSKTWLFVRGNLVAAVSVDYPFAEFHDLWECYSSTGWSLDRKTPHVDRESLPSYWIDIKMKKSGLHAGYLLFSEFNPKGETLEYESRWRQSFHRYEVALNALHELTAKRGGAVPEKLRGPAYQVQLFIETQAPLEDVERKAVDRLYFDAVKMLHEKIFAGQ